MVHPAQGTLDPPQANYKTKGDTDLPKNETQTTADYFLLCAFDVTDGNYLKSEQIGAKKTSERLLYERGTQTPRGMWPFDVTRSSRPTPPPPHMAFTQ